MTDLQDDYFHNDSATFGDRVTAAREAMGLSDESLSRKLGVKLKTLRAWEQDLGEPRANKLQMLSGMLNVSMRWLLTGEGDGPSEATEDGLDAADMAELLADLRRTKAEMQHLADRMGRMERRLLKVMENRDA
ncbi:MAG: helix-turn-helix domain-containing protein [Pseudomonadota bacterium]